MATWAIQSKTTFEDKYVEALGREEFDRRLAVADTKANELTDWKEQMFMRPQFHSVVMQLNPTQLAKMETWKSDRWATMVYRLAGV